jgi:hypothetical protein
MGRLKHGIAGKTTEELANAKSGRYTGKTPPRGMYKGTLRFLSVRGKKEKGKFKPQLNRNNDMMIKGAISIKMTGAKAKYNGYLINFNQNVSEQGTPYVNQLLDAISGGSEQYRQEFWAKFVAVDPDGNITHIGNSRYTDNTIELFVNTKDGKNQAGERTLEVAAFLLTQDENSDDEDEDETDEDSDDLDVDVDEDDEESEFEGDDEDPDDEDVEDEDEDDETDEDSDEDEDEDEDEDDSDEDDEEPDEDEAEDEDEAKEEYDADAMLAKYSAMDRATVATKAKEYGLKVFKSDTVEKLAAKVVEFEKEQPPF